MQRSRGHNPRDLCISGSMLAKKWSVSLIGDADLVWCVSRLGLCSIGPKASAADALVIMLGASNHFP